MKLNNNFLNSYTEIQDIRPTIPLSSGVRTILPSQPRTYATTVAGTCRTGRGEGSSARVFFLNWEKLEIWDLTREKSYRKIFGGAFWVSRRGGDKLSLRRNTAVFMPLVVDDGEHTHVAATGAMMDIMASTLPACSFSTVKRSLTLTRLSSLFLLSSFSLPHLLLHLRACPPVISLTLFWWDPR
ncbi:hypothetical protein C1H46_020165 [Malus baccata]|uniref:Uncharacterized protein n=1 Tax=Malus baccata TaxID=106549 RepID=A0A540M631_MALBA|nr:hypothetical protein C1H46_020165 [Malus baccata]